MTGWAQVNGRNAISWSEQFERDLFYVENCSFALDIKIILMTIFKVLKNEIVTFPDNNFRIIGIDDVLIGYGDPSIAYKADGNMYNLVLCHEPDVIDMIYSSNTDCMISGHTHGGQIRIPHYTQQILPPYGEKYVKGKYKLDNDIGTLLYVNNGLGTTKIPARFGAVPEITYLTITPTK